MEDQDTHTMRQAFFALSLLAAVDGAAQAYWQQQVDHVITVRLDDERHMLHGTCAFTYINNSPTTLDTIWVHLWPNAYRDRSTALCRQLTDHGNLDLYFATPEERGWIDSLAFTANGNTLAWGFHPRHIDIGWVKPDAPLAPGASTIISTPFRVKIPDGKFSRLGHTGQAYYITQWFPKPAVYDAQGWHAMPYLTQGEFYSEFGSYDVTITLPANYVVGATGVLQNNPAEEAWMNELATKPFSMSVSDGGNAFPASAAETKTLRFAQDNVHDFAWFADKRFLVRKSEVALPSGRTVRTWALFTPKNAALWDRATEYLNESVRLYSTWVGEYPYGACTAVDGTISAGGGMEYPMITIIGNMHSAESLDEVIAHEVGHNWFYGILASNERDHPWMDEGMNSFVELRYMRERHPGGELRIQVPGLKKTLGDTRDPHRVQSEQAYRFNARRNMDQPIELPAERFSHMNYGTTVYMKSALVFDHLFAYLGQEVFDRCMHAYFDEWKFKHPQPIDLRTVFERESGKDLGWVFDELIGTDNKIDVRALRLKGGTLTYRSSASKPFPFPITGWHGNDSLGTIWHEGGASKRQNATLPWSNVDRIRIDANERTLDIDRRNNTARSLGLFRSSAPVRLRAGIGIERPDERTIHYLPFPAWNAHDGFQVGLALTNTLFPSQRTEWVAAPLYALGSERVGGAARIEHHFDRMRSNTFRNIHLGLSGRSASTFHDHHANASYTKVSQSVVFDIKRPLDKPWWHSFGVRGIYLKQEAEATPPEGQALRHSSERYYGEFHYTATDGRKLHPFFVQPVITYGEEFVRGSLEVRQGFSLNERNDQFRLRGFFGTFFHKENDRITNGLHAWGLSWGAEDMLFDHAYFERGAEKGFTSRQFNKQQGAFKTPFLQGGSESWIVAINAELDLPIPLPIALFGSMGRVPTTTVTQTGRSTSAANYFEAGIGVIAARDVLEIWFPLVVSERIADEEKFLGRDVGDRIRFIFALEKLDPTKAIRKIRP
jgi:hypothetical protein